MRLAKRLWKSRNLRAALIAVVLACLVVVMTVDLAILYLAFADDRSAVGAIKDKASAAQSLVTIVAIIAGGVFAGIKLQAFRDFEPHVDVVHDVGFRVMNDAYIHLDVRATLHNSSKVKIEFRRALFSIQQVLPASDDSVRERHDEVFLTDRYRDMQWPVLDWVEHQWDPAEVVVEPGERHSEVQEFIVQRESAETVKVITYFYDSRTANSENPDPPPNLTPLHDSTPPVVPAKAGTQGGVGTRGSVENTPVRTCTSSSGSGFGENYFGWTATTFLDIIRPQEVGC